MDKGLINPLKAIAKEEDRSFASLMRQISRAYLESKSGFNKPIKEEAEK